MVKDFILFSKCSEKGDECACKEFVDDATEGYGFVFCDNCGVVFFMKEYDVAMLPFTRYYFLVVAL